MTEAQLDTGSAVSLSGVAKSYGSVLAVAGVDLRINRGEIVALLGPNGAGKSTLINMMLGLLPPDEGEIRLFGRTPARAVRSGQVGAMLQEGGLIPRVTVKELVGFVRGTYENPMPLPDVLRIAQTYVGGSLANEATMRLEELRAKHPNLFMPPPSVHVRRSSA